MAKKITDLTAASAFAKTMLFEVTEDPSGTPTSKKLTGTQLFALDDGTKTSSAPLLDMAQTWNSGGTTFTALKFNITDTASAAASLLMDLQVGGSTKLKVDKAGLIYGTSTGYLKIGNGIAIAPSGAVRGGMDSSGNLGLGSGVTFGFSSSSAPDATSGLSLDTILARDAANTLAQRNGTNAQAFRIYNTYSDASNYERLSLFWSAGNCFIGTEQAGTGSAKALFIRTASTNIWQFSSSGHFLGQTDNAYDIGASGANRPRSGYFGTSVVSPIATLATGTITTSQPALNVTQTWNAGAVTFNGMLLNVTDTASASASLLMDLQVGGASKFSVSKAGVVTTASNITCTGLISGTWVQGSTYLSVGSGSTLLYQDSAANLALRNSTTAQTFRVYNTFTDASNYERGVFDWGTAANTLTIGTQKAGTGSDRNMNLIATGAVQINSGSGYGAYFACGGTNFLGLNGAAGLVKIGATTLSFFSATAASQQTSGANLTNNVTSGGTDDTITNWTDLTTYATDATAIRNAVYQLARKLKQINDGLRSYGLFT